MSISRITRGSTRSPIRRRKCPICCGSIERQHLDPLRQIDHWARGFLDAGGRTDTACHAVEHDGGDRARLHVCITPEKGTQTPIEDAHLAQGHLPRLCHADDRSGTCAGFRGPRFVSGYVYSPTTRDAHVGGGNTHAWVRIYLPGSGWVEFDPTNGIIGNRGLIRVAVARDIYQAVPISGTWAGFPGSFLDMTVGVNISVQDAAAHPTRNTVRSEGDVERC